MRWRARAAFTLVELLVVIGVIAVLVGILLPALNSARQQAAAVKCAAALREIGTATQMYANDNRGWAPPGYLKGYYRICYTGYAKTGSIGQDDYGPQYWFQFLAKYVTRAKLGSSAAGTTAVEDRAAARRSILWGCPAFDGYISSAYTGGINYGQTGYGWNCWPEYTASYPDAGVVMGDTYFTPNTAPNAKSIINCLHGTDNTAYKQDWNVLTEGKWYKMQQYTQAGDRALAADAQFWSLESNAVPASGAIGGQKFFEAGSTWYTPNTIAQSTADCYRHGRLPRQAGSATGSLGGATGYYDTVGGKVAYNVLFCDGHVAAMTDRESVFRATRMRFPG